MSNFEPLAVIINPPPSSVLQIYPGQISELSIVVNNQELQGMVVEVYLDIPERLRPWCKVSRTSFNLDAGRSQSVEFSWEIPTEAIPNRYRYDLVVDSPNLRAPLLYSLELEVLTPFQTPVSSNDPTFTIQPLTSSTHPIELKTSPLTIQVLVHNRSNLVDDFRVTCPDLDDNWYTVRYPEGIQQQGLISGGNKLSLNPNTQGQILLLFHPPENIIAGNYRPTIRLHSTVNPDLLLQDIFYLYIPPAYKINFQIQTIREKVKNSSALYQIVSINEGNTIREIQFKPGTKDEEDICQYQIDPSKLKIPPGKTIAVGLKVKPTQRFGRPLFGAPKPITFKVDVEDLYQFPLPSYLPLKGMLLWASRPWWQLFLLVLSGVISVSSLAFLIWWLIIKPPILPEIESLEPTQTSYKFDDEIKLNWDIIHPQRLTKIELVGENERGEGGINKREFDKKQLQEDFGCKIIPSQEGEKLSCKNIPTSATKPDSYKFSLKLSAKKRWRVGKADEEHTRLITIAPPPTPTISNFVSTKTQYILPEQIELKFQVSEFQELEKIELKKNRILFYSLNQNQLNSFCQPVEKNSLDCSVAVDKTSVGTYNFSIEAIPKHSDYVKEPQGPVNAPSPIEVEEAKIPLKINLFSINDNDKVNQITLIKPNQAVVVRWNISGKDVKVSINVKGTPVGKDLSPIGNKQIPYQQLPVDLVSVNEHLDVEIIAKDANGETKSEKRFVKLESPSPSPSISIPDSSSSPSSSSNLKTW